MKKIHYHELM